MTRNLLYQTVKNVQELQDAVKAIQELKSATKEPEKTPKTEKTEKKNERREEKLCPLFVAMEREWDKCYGELCAWWDDERQQCVLKTIAENTCCKERCKEHCKR